MVDFTSVPIHYPHYAIIWQKIPIFKKKSMKKFAQPWMKMAESLIMKPLPNLNTWKLLLKKI